MGNVRDIPRNKKHKVPVARTVLTFALVNSAMGTSAFYLWFKFYRQSSVLSSIISFSPTPHAIPAISLKSTDIFRPSHFGAQTKHPGTTGVTQKNELQTCDKKHLFPYLYCQVIIRIIKSIDSIIVYCRSE